MYALPVLYPTFHVKKKKKEKKKKRKEKKKHPQRLYVCVSNVLLCVCEEKNTAAVATVSMNLYERPQNNTNFHLQKRLDRSSGVQAIESCCGCAARIAGREADVDSPATTCPSLEETIEAVGAAAAAAAAAWGCCLLSIEGTLSFSLSFFQLVSVSFS